MNRTFLAKLTPARARLLMLMAKHNDNVELDDAIFEKAEEERINPEWLHNHVEGEDEANAVQFILDTNWRAGIPTHAREKERGVRVVKAAVKLAQMGEDDVVYIDRVASNLIKHETFIIDFDYESLLPLRKKLLVLNLDMLDDHALSTDLVGKLFPRIVIAGTMQVQYSFSFGGSNATTSRMGSILHPQVEESLKRTTWKSNQRRSVLSMGVFPDLLNDSADIARKTSNNFIVPRTIQY